MKYFIPFILPILVGCSSNKEIINYTQNNSQKLNSIKTLSYTENTDYIAISKKINKQNILIAINPKDRDNEIEINSCKIDNKTTQISKTYQQNDNLPNWLNRYIISTSTKIKNNSTLHCILSNGDKLDMEI